MRLYRFSKAKYANPAQLALSGEGARITGGRWNHAGVRAVYTSLNVSLAILEILVHAGDPQDLADWVVIPLELPDQLLQDIPAALPDDWAQRIDYSRNLGTVWLKDGLSLALKVPSAIVAEEWNVLINPTHPGFDQIQILPTKPYLLDSRLWKG